MILTKSSDLNLNFSTELNSKLIELKQLNTLLTKELKIINDNFNQDEEDIKIGSIVLIKFDDETKIEGRVWGKKNYTGEYEVNRNGYKNYMNIPRKNLTNLSIGTLGELERKLWITQQKIQEYNKILENSKIPEILLENVYNVIEVVEIKHEFPCSIIEFVMAGKMQSSSIKIPHGQINDCGFYQLEVENNCIKSITRSSEIAFKYFKN